MSIMNHVSLQHSSSFVLQILPQPVEDKLKSKHLIHHPKTPSRFKFMCYRRSRAIFVFRHPTKLVVLHIFSTASPFPLHTPTTLFLAQSAPPPHEVRLHFAPSLPTLRWFTNGLPYSKPASVLQRPSTMTLILLVPHCFPAFFKPISSSFPPCLFQLPSTMTQI